MRRLVAVLVFLSVVVAPTAALARPRWYRGDQQQVTVYLERTRVGAKNWSYVKAAAARWALSGRIQVAFVRRCPSKYYCVKVYEGRSARNMAGWAVLNYDHRTNYAWYGSLHLNTRYLTTVAARRKTACHELGHVFGLGHRRTGRTCMRDGFTSMYGLPDATDYASLRRIYARP